MSSAAEVDIERGVVRATAREDPVMGMGLAYAAAERALVQLARSAKLPVNSGTVAATLLREHGLLPAELFEVAERLRRMRIQARRSEPYAEPPQPEFVDWYLDTAFKLADYVLELEPRATAPA